MDKIKIKISKFNLECPLTSTASKTASPNILKISSNHCSFFKGSIAFWIVDPNFSSRHIKMQVIFLPGWRVRSTISRKKILRKSGSVPIEKFVKTHGWLQTGIGVLNGTVGSKYVWFSNGDNIGKGFCTSFWEPISWS